MKFHNKDYQSPSSKEKREIDIRRATILSALRKGCKILCEHTPGNLNQVWAFVTFQARQKYSARLYHIYLWYDLLILVWCLGIILGKNVGENHTRFWRPKQQWILSIKQLCVYIHNFLLHIFTFLQFPSFRSDLDSAVIFSFALQTPFNFYCVIATHPLVFWLAENMFYFQFWMVDSIVQSSWLFLQYLNISFEFLLDYHFCWEVSS